MNNIKFKENSDKCIGDNNTPAEICGKCHSSMINYLTRIKLSCGHYFCRSCDIGIDINKDIPENYKCICCDDIVDDFKIVVSNHPIKWL